MAGAGKRGLLGAVSWILLAGALVMLWLVVLSGVTNHTPLNKIWFLRADTSGIGDARPNSQWTFWYVCGDNNNNCGSPVPALPLGYAWRGNSTGAPSALVGSHGHNTTSKYYYYMWRFGWVFFFIAFIFANFAALSGVLSCIRVVAGATGLLTLAATFWLCLAACLMSAVFVKARDRFQSDGRSASVGRYAFAFTWTSLVLLFLSACLFLGGVLIGRKKRDSGSYAKETAYNGNVGYPPGNQGFATDNVQSGYTTNAPQRSNIIREEVPEPTATTTTTKGGQGMRGLFPRHREASVV
ncbi:hypothetical protein VE01_06057 [Pseudogymnoascus verrucosus]|uniref:Uncharacterized protein n=1 Tax=Pseudogymnoascus verrucosus TaxID=342668 RepID=A0A1B8GJ77_9PEZI|nr:uncharacterized protein VE01_06057 [Pseudogymnoascus verrucosus]OBT95902.1 hypothetical protein VE01_06057 [Pseudogymnoascus verrucosus]